MAGIEPEDLIIGPFTFALIALAPVWAVGFIVWSFLAGWGDGFWLAFSLQNFVFGIGGMLSLFVVYLLFAAIDFVLMVQSTLSSWSIRLSAWQSTE